MSTTLAEIKARAAEAQHLESTSLAALQVLTGVSHVVIPDCPIEPVSFEPKTVADYQAQARSHHPGLHLLDAARAARQADLDATSARYFPDLGLALSVDSQYAPGRTPYAFYTPWAVGAAIVARWDLDLLGNHFRTERARHKLMELQEQQSLAAEGSDINIADKHAAVVDAAQRRLAWEDGHRDARRWFVAAAQNYQLGLITVRELTDGVSAYFRARFSHLQSIYDWNTSIAGLEQAVGTPLLPEASFGQRCDDASDDPSP
jgi:outer membrane protein TolC